MWDITVWSAMARYPRAGLFKSWKPGTGTFTTSMSHSGATRGKWYRALNGEEKWNFPYYSFHNSYLEDHLVIHHHTNQVILYVKCILIPLKIVSLHLNKKQFKIMKIGILHLTDAHFSSDKDFVYNKTSKIVAAVKYIYEDCDKYTSLSAVI